MSKRKITIELGKEYGYYTAIEDTPVGTGKRRKIKCICRCGNVKELEPAFLKGKYPMCKECSMKKIKEKPREDIIGRRFGSWDVMSLGERNKRDVWQYKCKCIKCGNISNKTIGELKNSNGNGCSKCRVDYHFKIHDGIAEGVLRDGTPFLIDAEDAERFSQRKWKLDSKGYIKSRRVRLQNFIMNMQYNNEIFLDHINRIKTDCRKSNLRYVNAQQNTMNISHKSNSISGLKGVTYVTSKDTFVSRIWLNDKCVYLGSSHDPIVAAQMYNIAAKLLFKEYAGGLNDVPEPRGDMVERIEIKCQPRMAEAALASRRVVFTSMQIA